MYSILWHVIGSLKKKIWFKNKIKEGGVSSQSGNDTAWFPQKSAPYVSVLKLQYHSCEATALSLHFSIHTLPTWPSIMLDFPQHWCSNAVFFKQSMSYFLAQWMKQNKTTTTKKAITKKKKKKAHTFNCTGLRECLKITLHIICTGPRFTMHSLPMTELSISG